MGSFIFSASVLIHKNSVGALEKTVETKTTVCSIYDICASFLKHIISII